MSDSNPFCSRYLRPGATAFVFPEGKSAPSVVARLRATGWRGAIVGPHGSGKSTLLATLGPELRRAGRAVIVATLHDGPRPLPRGVRARLAACRRRGQPAIIVIDGYEQLTRWSRWTLGRLVRRHDAGLLVTSHVSAALPTLWRAEVRPKTALAVLDHLLARSPRRLITPEDLRQRLEAHSGNLREALFDLYDLHQARERTLAAVSLPV